MHTSSRSMGIQMLLLASVLLELLNLYIIQVSTVSFSGQNHVRVRPVKTGDHNNLQLASRTFQAPALETRILSGDSSSGLPTSFNQDHQQIAPTNMVRSNKMDDLFLKTPAASGQNDDDDDDQRRPPTKQYNNQIDAYNTINLDNSLESESEPEIVTSNHQSGPYETPPLAATLAANTNQAKHNSRHYGQQSSIYSNHYHNHQNYHHHHHHNNNYNHQNGQHHYGKYSPNIFANNYNLNYIHSFLTNKPSLLAPLSPSQPAQLPSSSSPTPAIQQHYASSAALSVAVGNLQQTIAQQQQQQQLAIANSQPQNQPSSNVPALSGNQTSDEAATNRLIGPSSPMCGRQQVVYREPRVVGGNRTYEGEFPWAVSIQRHGNHHCGGVIVGRRWILTAAHCVRSQLVTNLAVRTGGHTLARSTNGLNGHLERDYQVEQIVMHDDFSRYDNLTASQMKSSANTNNADIALLKLRQEIHLNDLAWPVCFPQRDAGNFSGHDATVIGWGKLNEKSEEFSNELQKVKLTIIDNKVCQNWFRQAGRDMPIDDRIICAGFKHGGKDACHGDSGGPLLSRINGQYVVVGVVSTGIGCARPLLPGLYSRVSSYINWIERHITI